MLNRLITFDFGSIQSSFGIWNVETKEIKKKKKEFSTQNTEQHGQNTEPVFNSKYRATH